LRYNLQKALGATDVAIQVRKNLPQHQKSSIQKLIPKCEKSRRLQILTPRNHHFIRNQTSPTKYRKGNPLKCDGIYSSASVFIFSVFFQDKGSELISSTPMSKKELGTELFSQTVTRQVSLPQLRFTSEFGMGRCGSTAPSAPRKRVVLIQAEPSRPHSTKKRGQALGRFARLGFICYQTTTERRANRCSSCDLTSLTE
jgi:hypothetical protein